MSNDAEQSLGEFQLALDVKHPLHHEAADAFWKYWRENGETHVHGYYESTWGAINRAIRLVGVVPHGYGKPVAVVNGVGTTGRLDSAAESAQTRGETPRTDAVAHSRFNDFSQEQEEITPADFARELERELAETKERCIAWATSKGKILAMHENSQAELTATAERVREWEEYDQRINAALNWQYASDSPLDLIERLKQRAEAAESALAAAKGDAERWRKLRLLTWGITKHGLAAERWSVMFSVEGSCASVDTAIDALKEPRHG